MGLGTARLAPPRPTTPRVPSPTAAFCVCVPAGALRVPVGSRAWEQRGHSPFACRLRAWLPLQERAIEVFASSAPLCQLVTHCPPALGDRRVPQARGSHPTRRDSGRTCRGTGCACEGRGGSGDKPLPVPPTASPSTAAAATGHVLTDTQPRPETLPAFRLRPSRWQTGLSPGGELLSKRSPRRTAGCPLQAPGLLTNAGSTEVTVPSG